MISQRTKQYKPTHNQSMQKICFVSKHYKMLYNDKN